MSEQQQVRGLALPTLEDVSAAAERLRGVAVRTPLLESEVLNAHVGGRVFVKPETLQRVGAFKFRGAYNAVSQIDRTQFPGGVVACSSGNHAQGVACAARLVGVPAVIVMPSDAPALKRERTQSHGAEIVLYNRVREDREAIAKEIAGRRGMAFVHPYDDFNVIAGQGTVGLEIMADLEERNLSPDAILACCSGGGLTSGIATAVKGQEPDTDIHTDEPATFEDFARSLQSGVIATNAQMDGSICDALLSPSPGERTFAIGQNLFSDGLVVSDQEVQAAQRFAFHELKLVVEPGGAAALAAVLQKRLPTEKRVIVCVLSGGNADPSAFADTLGEA